MERHWGTIQRQERQKQDIERTAEQSTARMKDTLREANAARDVGQETMVNLRQQTETLQRVDDTLTANEDNLTFSARTLRGMSSLWGSFRNAVSKAPKPVERPQRPASPPRPQRSTQGERAPTMGRDSAPPSKPRQYDDTLSGRVQTQIDQQDQDLDTLQGLLGDMKNMGVDMNKELDKQVGMLDRIDTRATDQDHRIQKMNKQIRGIK
mmetsp:Transcript_112560/g.168442  ORF Transcript_112560/g.168442 Transcript_112560/m.168442 type:complete len:209 (+) Transcript_112560:3-629(+)